MLREIRRVRRIGKGSPRKRLAVCVLHIVLWPVLLIPRLIWPRRKLQKLPDAPRILLMRIDGIGDLAMIAAIFPSLRKQYPAAQIDLLVSDNAQAIAELFVEAGWVNRLWVAPLAGRRDYRRFAREFRAVHYDAGVDLRGDMRSILLMWYCGIPIRLGLAGSGMTYLLTGTVDLPDPHHQAEESAELVLRLGVERTETWPRLPLSAAHLAAADRWIADQGLDLARPICAFHLGSLFPSKIWPVDRFVGVAQRLMQDLNAQIIVVGSAAEVGLTEAFAATVGKPVTIAAGKTSLQLTAGIFARCTLFIGNDSGPAHVAAGVGCPAVVIFGRGHPGIYRPLSPKAAIMVPSHPCCAGCNITCASPKTWCILDHTVETVTKTALDLLKEVNSARQSG